MKNKFRHLILSLCAIFLLGGINSVSAQQSKAAEILFSLAEINYPQFFPNPQTTMIITPWTYRFYPSTNIYLGVNDDDNVHVLGGDFGSDPLVVGTLTGLLAQLATPDPDGNGSTPVCDVPEGINIPQNTGINISQNGNTFNITTDGCITLPEDQDNFCETPMPSTATGISILFTNNVKTVETTGIIIDAMGLPFNPIQSFQDGINSASCTINAPADQGNFTANSDICFDVANQYSGIPGVTVNPPATLRYVSTGRSQVVTDCFATDAEFIDDAFTGEEWSRDPDGSFSKDEF